MGCTNPDCNTCVPTSSAGSAGSNASGGSHSSAGSVGSATSATSSDAPGICDPLSCGEELGGTRFCQSIGLPVCTVLDDLPCIACSDFPSSESGDDTSSAASATPSSSSSSSSEPFNSCLSICGNGDRECNEECDDGNTANNDSCNGSCRIEGGECGDGIIQSLRGENCEPNLTDPSTACDSVDCRLIEAYAGLAVCGNGRREGMEECDDGNLNGGLNSACNASCKRTSGSCGNGIVESGRGEDCEPSLVSADAPLACSSSCQYVYFSHQSSAPVLVQDTRQCAGNECSLGGSDFCGVQNMTCEAISDLPCLQCVGDACATDADCAEGAQCRDGVCVLSLAPGGIGATASTRSSQSSASSVSSAPLFVAMAGCGNGELGVGEQCDDGLKNSLLPNAFCRPDCTFGRCGDTVIDAPLEICDDGSQNGLLTSQCDAFCRFSHAAPGVLPATLIELPFMPASGSDANGTTGIGGSEPVFIAGGAQPPATTASGPATIAIMAAGASAGYAWMRRRR